MERKFRLPTYQLQGAIVMSKLAKHYSQILLATIILMTSSHSFAQGYADGLNYYLHMMNYSDQTVQITKGSSDCIQGVSGIKALAPNVGTQLNIDTDALCSDADGIGMSYQNFNLSLQDTTGGINGTFSIGFNMTNNPGSTHCMNYAVLNLNSDNYVITYEQEMENVYYGYYVKSVYVNICNRGDSNCQNLPFEYASSCQVGTPPNLGSLLKPYTFLSLVRSQPK